MLTFERVWEALRENNTYVTYLKERTTIHGTTTIWTVGDDMERITIDMDGKEETLLMDIEVAKLESRKKTNQPLNTDKLRYFRKAMVLGRIECNADLYKKYTLKQLQQLVN